MRTASACQLVLYTAHCSLQTKLSPRILLLEVFAKAALAEPQRNQHL